VTTAAAPTTFHVYYAVSKKQPTMAFERPLEADRVDDLGFLSSFVRAPIVGPLMYLLGGDMAKKLNKEGDEDSSRLDKKCNRDGCGGEDSVDVVPPEEVGDNMIASDVSDSGDSGSSVSDDEEEEPLFDKTRRVRSMESSLHRAGLTKTVNNLSISRGRRRLSFSDEVPGQSLAEIRYVVNKVESLVQHEQRVGSSSSLTRSQPTKSAMKKSGSFRSSGSAASKRSAPPASSKFVPSGIVGGKGGGIVMPSGGGMLPPQGPGSIGGASAANNGHVSPQWGWYISTTPPTPERYYSSRKGKLGKKQTKVSEDRLPPSVAEEYPMPVFKNSPTPVFRKSGAKDVFGQDNMGWPSVPL